MRVCVVCFFILFHSASQAVQSLVVRAQTYVQSSKDIYLSDIVEMENLSESVRVSLQTVKLANGPRLGERQVLSSESISRLIRKHLSRLKLPEKMRLKIPSQVIVENHGFSLKSGDVEQRLKKHWATFCRDCEFQIFQMMLPKTKTHISPTEWSLVLDTKTPRGQFSYQVKENGKNIGWVQGTVKMLKNVPVATRAMHFGERINGQDFEVTLKDVTYAHDSPARTKNLEGRRIKRALRAGDVIWSNTLEKVLAAQQGQPVKMVMGSSDWRLTLQGVAQMNGQVGDTISVKNPQSNKILSGVITKNREVHIQ